MRIKLIRGDGTLVSPENQNLSSIELFRKQDGPLYSALQSISRNVLDDYWDVNGNPLDPHDVYDTKTQEWILRVSSDEPDDPDGYWLQYSCQHGITTQYPFAYKTVDKYDEDNLIPYGSYEGVIPHWRTFPVLPDQPDYEYSGECDGQYTAHQWRAVLGTWVFASGVETSIPCRAEYTLNLPEGGLATLYSPVKPKTFVYPGSGQYPWGWYTDCSKDPTYEICEQGASLPEASVSVPSLGFNEALPYVGPYEFAVFGPGIYEDINTVGYSGIIREIRFTCNGPEEGTLLCYNINESATLVVGTDNYASELSAGLIAQSGFRINFVWEW